MTWSVPATGAGLWPQGLICPGVSNRGYWDSVAATGCPKCFSPTADRVCVAPMYIYIFTRGPLSCSSRERNSMMLLLFVLCECSARLPNMCGQPHMYVYLWCTPVLQPYYWLDLGSWSCGILGPVGLRGLAISNKYKVILKNIKNVGHLLTKK